VRVETDTAAQHDDAAVTEETTDSVAPEIDEPQDTGAGEDTSDIEEILESEDRLSDDAGIEGAEDVQPAAPKHRIKWSRVVAFGVLPILALLLAAAAGFLKWQDSWTRISSAAGIESVTAAKESTVALLSYQPDTVEKDLGAARDRLTGKFKESYTQLVQDVVIPGAKKDHISAIATVPAAASVSATPKHAVALVFVNQTVTVGNDAPTDTASTVRVTLDKSGDRWLISAFDPV
jgi:Mce-associated membrane protein